MNDDDALQALAYQLELEEQEREEYQQYIEDVKFLEAKEWH